MGSSCVQVAYKRLVLQYGEGAGLAEAPFNDKAKRKPKKHTSIIML